MGYGIGFSIACVVLYTIAMFGVRAFAHRVGLIGGLLTIAAMFIASYWYDHRKCRAPWKTAPSASRGIAPSSDS
jgi:hypothetical protein